MNKIILVLAIATISLILATWLSYNKEQTEYLAAVSSPVSLKSTTKTSSFRADMPSHLFERDLEEKYPATWNFYSRLDTISKDSIYSFYLYNPDIVKVRHKIFQLTQKTEKGATKHKQDANH